MMQRALQHWQSWLRAESHKWQRSKPMKIQKETEDIPKGDPMSLFLRALAEDAAGGCTEPGSKMQGISSLRALAR